MASASDEAAPGLPSDLSAIAIERFDQLNESGKLIYGASPTPEIVQHEGFTFQFSTPPALSTKPILPPSDPSRSKPGGPFLHPDPDFVLCTIPPSHTLELNKHCILRPMYILHTTEYEKQAEDLGKADIQATWAVMKELNKESKGEGKEIMAIYNCGAEAGASQGHKHVQLFPKPKREEFELFPDRVSSVGKDAMSCDGIPYKHWLSKVPADATAEEVHATYANLMENIRPVLKENGTEDYNMILTMEWMLLIPRRHHGREGVEANAVGMMGMVWVKGEEEREGWNKFGMTKHLKYLGVPA